MRFQYFEMEFILKDTYVIREISQESCGIKIVSSQCLKYKEFELTTEFDELL